MTQTHFSKKHSISDYDNSYQIVVTGDDTGRHAVITKFANEKTYSLAKWYSDHCGKADSVDTGYKKLSHARDMARSHVEGY